MIRLHYHPGNASFTPHALLRELGLPFELVLVDRAQGEHKSARYLRLNPNGLIPVLEDGDLVLYETAAIGLHLVDKVPEAGWAPPPGSVERAHFYKWLVWMCATLQPMLMTHFYPERVIAPGHDDCARRVHDHAEQRVVALLQQLDEQLAAQGGPWLLGERVSLVDLYGFMLCRWTRGFASRPAREFTHIAPWLARVLERPAVTATFAAEGLGEPFY